MKIQRTLPPTAAPLYFSDLWNGFKGFFFGKWYLQRLEKEMREYFGVKHVFFVSSGKAALYLILSALKSLRPERNEVLIPAYTCFSVPSAIVKAGLKVALCDIDGSTFDFDHKLLKEAVNENTLCVIPDHLFSIPADMDNVMTLCRDRNTYVVEDAAQAMGTSYKGRLLGTIGDVGLFSLGRGKVITCGSGGIVVTNDETIGEAIAKEYGAVENPSSLESMIDLAMAILLSIFICPWLYWAPVGMPFLRLGETIFYSDFPVKRFHGVKAGMLMRWKKCLEESQAVRRRNARYLIEKLGIRAFWDLSVPLLRLPITVDRNQTREAICAESQSMGLGLTRMYPAPVSEIIALGKELNRAIFPRAKQISQVLLTLPTNGYITKKDSEEIIGLLGQHEGSV